MRFAAYPVLSIAFLVLSLSACATYQPMVPQASFVDKVDVELKQDVASPTIGAIVASKTRRESTRYGHSGAPKDLRIAITGLHYKNALQSALIGDANTLGAHVAVFDAVSGKANGEFDAVAIDQAALNGLAGIMISALQDRNEVDQRLAQQLAANVMEQVYGSAVAKEASQHPPVDHPQPAPAVAPAATSGPKPAAGKAKGPAMAMVSTSAAR